MNNIFYCFILCSLLVGFIPQSFGQNPELKRLYEQAQRATAAREYDKAINSYFQAIRIKPNDVVIRRDLAYTYYLAGKIKEGKQAIIPVINSDKADPQCYRIAAALEQADGSEKKARRVIAEGLKKFPKSGLLHYSKALGILKNNPKHTKSALNAFIDGIYYEPKFADNYLGASKILLERENEFWSIIYAETYLLLEPFGSKSLDAKKTLCSGYQALFKSQTLQDLPAISKRKSSKFKNKNFARASEHAYFTNYGALNGLFTPETLTMLRTRFLLTWVTNNNVNEHSIYAYWDRLLRAGHFDAYHQLTFGAYLDSQEYVAWKKRNPQAEKKLMNWLNINQYLPANDDPHYD